MKEIILIADDYKKHKWLCEHFVIYFLYSKNQLHSCLNKFDSDIVLIECTEVINCNNVIELVSLLQYQKNILILSSERTQHLLENHNFLNCKSIIIDNLSNEELLEAIRIFLKNVNHFDKKFFHRCLSTDTLNLIAEISFDGDILFVNNSFLKILGYSQKQLLLNPFYSILDDSYKSKFLNCLKESSEINCRSNLKVQLLNSKNSPIWYKLSIEYSNSSNNFFIYCDQFTSLSDINSSISINEERYKELINLSKIGIWVFDKNSVTTTLNERMAGILNYTIDEMVGKPVFYFMDETEIEVFENAIKKNKNGTSEQFDFEFKNKDGLSVYVTLEISPIFNELNNYNGSVAGIIDISEKKLIQQELVQSLDREKQLSHLIKDSPIGIVTFNKSGKIIFFNLKFLELLNLSEIKIKNADPFLENTCSFLKEEILSRTEKDPIESFKYEHNNNSLEVTVKAVFNKNNELLNYNVFFTNITHSIESEKQLRFELETNKLTSLISTKIISSDIDLNDITKLIADNLICLLKINYILIATINNAERTVDLHYHNFDTCLNSENKIISFEEFTKKLFPVEKIISSKGPQIENNPKHQIFNNCYKQKQFRIHNFISSPEYISKRLTGFIFAANSLNNFTNQELKLVHHSTKLLTLANQRKNIEEKQNHLQDILFNIFDELFVVDLSTLKFSYANKVAVANTGYSFNELIEMSPMDISALQDKCKLKQIVSELISGTLESYTIENIHRRKDGTEYPVEITIKFYKSSDTKELLVICRDISEKKQQEKEKIEIEASMKQQQKLEALGILASGVAHEINNPLMGIINYAELINRRTDDEKFKQFSSGIIEEGERVAKIVKSLLSFARQKNESFNSHNIADIINSSLVLIGSALRNKNISIDTNYSEDLDEVVCKSQQIQQVFINLLTNSMDSLINKFALVSSKKKINISSSNITIDKTNYVQIIFEDNGEGIKKDSLEQIFNPFFTTKKADKGTGLGLSICKDIITEHKGKIYCESVVSSFTKFFILLPTNKN